MSSAMLTPCLIQRFLNQAGAGPLAGGMVYSYIAGTSTPQATYTDQTGATPNANPVVLDATGSAEIWMGNASYKFVVTDSLNNVQFTVDNVQSIASQIAAAVNVAGALSILNNLSDVNSVSASLKNLGIAPYTYPTKFSVTNGQSATNLSGETVDGTVYTSVIYQFEIIQGTTIFASGHFSIQYLNSTWQLIMGDTMDNGTVNGVTFSLTQATSIAQLQAAESGLGNGTLKLKKSYFLATP